MLIKIIIKYQFCIAVIRHSSNKIIISTKDNNYNTKGKINTVIASVSIFPLSG